jgi:hypothetical protein
VRPGCEISMHYFSCLGGTDTDSTESVSAHFTSYLCFCIWWDPWVTYCIPVLTGANHRDTIFDARVGLVWIPQKAHCDTLHQSCVFATGGIYGSGSVLQCIWGANR